MPFTFFIFLLPLLPLLIVIAAVIAIYPYALLALKIAVLAMLVVMLIGMIVGIFYVVATWTIYVKANRPGWACLAPGYNLYVLCEMAGMPGWCCALLAIPILNLFMVILLSDGLATNFGRGKIFASGLFLLGFVCVPILAFGKSQYIGETMVRGFTVIPTAQATSTAGTL